MNKKTKNILICVIAVVGVLLLSAGLFMMLRPNLTNKELLVDALSKEIENLSDDSKSNVIYDFPKKFYDEDVVAKLISEIKLSDSEEESSDIELKSEVYSSLDKFYLTMTAKDNSSENFSLDALLKDNILYHKINNKYSNFYHTEFNLDDFNDQMNSLNFDDIDFDSIIDDICEVLLNEIKEEKVTKNEKEIKLGEKEYTLDKVTVKFTEKDVYVIAKNIIKKLKDNKEFQKIMNSNEELKNLNLEDVITEFESMIRDADDKSSLFSFSLYLDGDDILSYEFAISVKSDDADVTIKFVVNTYESDGKENVEAYISVMGMKMLGFELHEINDKKADFKFYVMNTMEVSGIVEESDKTMSLKVTGVLEEELDNGDTDKHEFIDANVNFENISDDEVNIDYDINFDFDGEKFTITSDSSYTIVDEFPNVDVSDSKPIEDMSDKDKKAYEEIFGAFDISSDLQVD